MILLNEDSMEMIPEEPENKMQRVLNAVVQQLYTDLVGRNLHTPHSAQEEVQYRQAMKYRMTVWILCYLECGNDQVPACKKAFASVLTELSAWDRDKLLAYFYECCFTSEELIGFTLQEQVRELLGGINKEKG